MSAKELRSSNTAVKKLRSSKTAVKKLRSSKTHVKEMRSSQKLVKKAAQQQNLLLNPTFTDKNTFVFILRPETTLLWILLNLKTKTRFSWRLAAFGCKHCLQKKRMCTGRQVTWLCTKYTAAAAGVGGLLHGKTSYVRVDSVR